MSNMNIAQVNEAVDDDGEEFEYESSIPTQCSQGDYHISSSTQLEQLYECDDIVGSVIINNYQGPTIDTGDIKTISGDFIVSNASNLVRINIPKLAVIGGRFSLSELTSLTSVHAPTLTEVGSINWNVLPILSTVSFDNGVKKIKSITISDTSLIGFSGFDIDYLDTLNINNNRFLESINANLKGVKEKLTISANAKNILVSLPNLEWANNITIRDVSSINLSNIERVNASFELIDNNFQAVKFPKLSNVGGTLSLIENYNLKEVEFPNINEIGGGLMVVNNTQLSKINFFPKLMSIGGAIEFYGDFKDTTFNKLRLVKGSAIIHSKSDALDCGKWTRGSEENSGSIVRGGKISCIAGSKQQVVKFDQEGEIIDEDISIIDDENKKDRTNFQNSASNIKFMNLGYKEFLLLSILMIVVLN
ncbi:unnamed protein product [Wickerhamomyces anomalus]